MRKSLPLLVTLLAAVFASATGQQATRPNLNGVWVLDTVNSPGPTLPQALKYTISQRGDTVKIKRETKSRGAAFSNDFVYRTDGKAWKNTVSEGTTTAEVSSVLAWEGGALVITSTVSANGREIHQVERLLLDPTGMTLTAQRKVDAMGQSFATTLLFRKQS